MVEILLVLLRGDLAVLAVRAGEGGGREVGGESETDTRLLGGVRGVRPGRAMFLICREEINES